MSSGPKRPSGSLPASPPSPLDDDGVYRARGRFSVAVVVVYVVLLLVLLFVVVPREATTFAWVPYFLSALIVFLVVRYLSTTYRIDESELRAARLLGGRKIPLDQIRRIEYSALRDLAATGMLALGPIGWHGRLWSPVIGEFDTVFTDAGRGLLVTAAGNPLYISPQNPEEFARELSRRVRSYTGPLEKDVGHPGPG